MTRSLLKASLRGTEYPKAREIGERYHQRAMNMKMHSKLGIVSQSKINKLLSQIEKEVTKEVSLSCKFLKQVDGLCVFVLNAKGLTDLLEFYPFFEEKYFEVKRNC